MKVTGNEMNLCIKKLQISKSFKSGNKMITECVVFGFYGYRNPLKTRQKSLRQKVKKKNKIPIRGKAILWKKLFKSNIQ